jgi:replicative DNA helicase
MYDPTTSRNGNGHHRNGDTAHRDGGAFSILTDRLPPQNLDAERGVLCSVLLDNAAMHEVAEILTAEDFFRAVHAEIYATILGLYDAGKPFDVLILAEAMGDRYRVIGGDAYLAEVTDSVPHAANAVHYAQIVRQKAIARGLILAADEIRNQCHSNDLTAEQMVESAERAVFAISEAEATGGTLGAAEVLDLALENIAVRERGEVTGIGSGFADLDDLTDGMQPENLIVVAARPGQGKTSWAMNVADHVATRGGAGVLFVSLEMNRVELGMRLLSARARVDGWRLKNPGALTHEDRLALGMASGALRGSRLFIDDTPMRTVTQIAANARRTKARHGLGLVVVDYIQLIDGQRQKGESRQEEVARISRRLKALARELKVPVIALAQLNRESEKRDDRKPRLSDLRESGAIEQDADIVLLLHRPEYYDPNDRPGEADLIVAKNRNGATGTVKLVFLRHCTRFESMAPHVPPADGTEF